MTATPRIAMIWAQTSTGVIGQDNSLPWYIPEDFAHFKARTLGAPVVMGRKTWQSLPDKSRPLPGRTNIVISRDPLFSAPGATVVTTLDSALAQATEVPGCETVWIIGGASIYRALLERADLLAVTVIDADIAGDAFAPELDGTWHEVSREPESGWQESRTGTRFAWIDYARGN